MKLMLAALDIKALPEEVRGSINAKQGGQLTLMLEG